jgi:hypothetical protein
MRSRSTNLGLTLLLPALFLLSGCGAKEVAVPDVVGLPLDEAHRVLEKLGFEEFDDRDKFEDRSVLLDANWVVLESEPAAGDKAAIDETVVFSVGKRDERRAVELLPAESSVAREFAAKEEQGRQDRAEQQAKDAEAAAAEAAHRTTLVTDYINQVDPMLRLATNVYAELDATAAGVRKKSYGGTQMVVVSKAVDAADMAQVHVAVLVPPSGSRRAGTHKALVAAAQRWDDAARTLLSADGVGRESSLARFAEVRTEARESWNQSLTALYADTGVAPPLLP